MISEIPLKTERDPLASAIARAQSNLLRLQRDDGHWCGELLADSTLVSDYVAYMHWAGEVDPVLQEKCVAHIRQIGRAHV